MVPLEAKRQEICSLVEVALAPSVFKVLSRRAAVHPYPVVPPFRNRKHPSQICKFPSTRIPMSNSSIAMKAATRLVHMSSLALPSRSTASKTLSVVDLLLSSASFLPALPMIHATSVFTALALTARLASSNHLLRFLLP